MSTDDKKVVVVPALTAEEAALIKLQGEIEQIREARDGMDQEEQAGVVKALNLTLTDLERKRKAALAQIEAAAQRKAELVKNQEELNLLATEVDETVGVLMKALIARCGGVAFSLGADAGLVASFVRPQTTGRARAGRGRSPAEGGKSKSLWVLYPETGKQPVPPTGGAYCLNRDQSPTTVLVHIGGEQYTCHYISGWDGDTPILEEEPLRVASYVAGAQARADVGADEQGRHPTESFSKGKKSNWCFSPDSEFPMHLFDFASKTFVLDKVIWDHQD